MNTNTANIPEGYAIPKNVVLNTDNEVVEVLDSIAIYEHICEKDGRKRVLTLNLVGTTPAHLKGWELVQKRELMTVGISIGNGYFNKERMEIILTGMANYFSEVVAIVPDIPAVYTYQALGYDKHHAEQRVKEHRNKIVNCCESIINESQKFDGRNIKLRLMTWHDDFTQQEYYQQAYKQALEIYQSGSQFMESIQRNTRHYILARLKDQDIQQLGGVDHVVEKAVHYLIEEMALHDVFEVVLGNEPIASYYKELELIPNYANGKYDNTPNKHVGWVVYNIVDSE